MEHELPPLPYPKEALEPHIDSQAPEMSFSRFRASLFIDNLPG